MGFLNLLSKPILWALWESSCGRFAPLLWVSRTTVLSCSSKLKKLNGTINFLNYLLKNWKNFNLLVKKGFNFNFKKLINFRKLLNLFCGKFAPSKFIKT